MKSSTVAAMVAATLAAAQPDAPLVLAEQLLQLLLLLQTLLQLQHLLLKLLQHQLLQQNHSILPISSAQQDDWQEQPGWPVRNGSMIVTI